jgi:hypothetical protein
MKNKQAFAAFEKLVNRHGYRSYDEAFYSVLDSLLHIATAGKEFEREYTAAVEAYGKEQLTTFLQLIADASEGFTDVLGDIYEEIRASGKASQLGQYFTPEGVARLMAMIVGGGETGEPMTLADNAGCGSGRNLLAMGARVAKDRWRHQFYGIDIDPVCVKMATINCWLQTISSIIVHGDGLAITYWGAYEVILNWDAEAAGWCAFVVKLSKEQVAAMQGLQSKSVLTKVLNTANGKRIENLEAHKAKREALAALESPVILPVSDDNPEDDKVIAPIDTAPIQPVASGRRGKPTPPNQAALF